MGRKVGKGNLGKERREIFGLWQKARFPAAIYTGTAAQLRRNAKTFQWKNDCLMSRRNVRTSVEIDPSIEPLAPTKYRPVKERYQLTK